MSDIEDHMAMQVHDIVGELRTNDIKHAEEVHKREQEARAALRAEQGAGLTSNELMKLLDGDDEETRQAKLDAQLNKIQKEAAEAAASKEPKNDENDDRFPAPPLE